MASFGKPARPRQLLVLGSGTSTGVPVLGCDCEVCRSIDPRNNRTRASVVFRLPAGDILVDTTPEMRIQLLREKIGCVDAILYTHYHADHLFGLDDARLFPKHLGRAVPVYCEADVERVVRRAFDYAFGGPVVAGNWVGIPQIEFKTIRPAERFEVLGESILPIRFKHGKFQVVGFRVDNLAYCTDVSAVPDESWEHLEGLDVLILDALRYEPHPTHLSLDQALAIIDRLKPRRTFLTHLSHTFDHAPTESTLPEGVALAYDGLAIDF